MSAPLSYVQQVSKVLSQLNEDIEACDFKWSLFVVASRSYRFDSRLSPYPTQFISATHKYDIEKILVLIAKVPSFITLRRLLRQPNHGAAPADVIDLLHWVLCKLNDPFLQSVPKAQVRNSLPEIKRFFSAIIQNKYSSRKWCRKWLRLDPAYHQHTSSKWTLSLAQWLR